MKQHSKRIIPQLKKQPRQRFSDLLTEAEWNEIEFDYDSEENFERHAREIYERRHPGQKEDSQQAKTKKVKKQTRQPEKKPNTYFNVKAFTAAYFLYQNGVKLTASERLVLLSLARHANKDTGDIHPRMYTLHEETGLSERTVNHLVRQLSSNGLIEIMSRPGKTNLYTLLFYDPRPTDDDDD